MKILRLGIVGLLGLVLSVANSQAGGLYLYEVGSPDVGLAAAGYAARAQDASTAFTNPAGMTRLKQPSLMLGAQPMYLHLSFDPDSDTSQVAGNLPLRGGSADDGDSNGWMPAGGLFYVHPVNDKLALGLAVTGYFGLALDYQNDWVGRYYVQETTLQAAGVQPAIAWQVNDRLSVGAGVAVLNGVLKDKVAINNIDPLVGDGQLKYKDTDWTVQYNLGVLYEPVDGTRFGLTYLSEADLNFSDKVDLRGLGPRLQTDSRQYRPLGRKTRHRHHHAPGGHVQRLPPVHRPPGPDGQPGLAGLVAVRLRGDRRLFRKLCRSDCRPRFQGYLACGLRRPVPALRAVAVVGRHRLRQRHAEEARCLADRCRWAKPGASPSAAATPGHRT